MLPKRNALRNSTMRQSNVLADQREAQGELTISGKFSGVRFFLVQPSESVVMFS